MKSTPIHVQKLLASEGRPYSDRGRDHEGTHRKEQK